MREEAVRWRSPASSDFGPRPSCGAGPGFLSVHVCRLSVFFSVTFVRTENKKKTGSTPGLTTRYIIRRCTIMPSVRRRYRVVNYYYPFSSSPFRLFFFFGYSINNPHTGGTHETRQFVRGTLASRASIR